MADVNINESSSLDVHSLMGDIEGAFDAMRVIHDIMMDQLCGHAPSDAKSSMRVNERLFVLLGSLENKLGEARTLRDKVATTIAAVAA